MAKSGHEDEDEDEDEEAWNAKVIIAKRVVPVLRSYRRFIESGERCWSIPDWVVNEDESLDEVAMRARWLEYLDAMIEAFNCEIDGEVRSAKRAKAQERGLYLFAKYYPHLWD